MKKVISHRGHAFCGGLCLPHFLFDEFQSCLGPKAEQFDLLVWVVRRDKQREQEQIVVEEPLTWWRDAFKAELRARGWTRPRPRYTEPQAQGTSASGIVYPCFHAPPCLTTWACGKKQLEDRQVAEGAAGARRDAPA